MTRARALLVVMTVIVTTACGVPTDSDPRAIADQDVPFDLLAPSTTTTTTSTTTPVVTEQIAVYLIGEARLQPVIRQLAGPVGVGDALRSLLAGATDDEADAGLRSAIPTDTSLLAVAVQGGVARIDVSAQLTNVQGEEQIAAVAQLVFTATGVEGVSAVQFLLEGEPVDVPRGDGTLTSGELTRGAFPELGPAPAGG